MKNNDILIYGGIAAAAYFLFLKPKAPPVSPLPATFIPSGAGTTQTYLPPVTSPPITNSLTSLATSINNLFNPPVSASQQAPAVNTSNFDQQIADTILPTAPLVPATTSTQDLLKSTLISSTYQMPLLNTPTYVDGFNNNTIYTTKGTLISGASAARIGLY